MTAPFRVALSGDFKKADGSPTFPDFDLQPLPDKDGLQWVQATPRQKDGQLANMKVGFRGDQLAALEILDSFGQRSVLTFTGMQVNAGVNAEAFRFTPPKGADVVQAN